MSRIHSARESLSSVVEESRALLAATAKATRKDVIDARLRLAAALEATRGAYGPPGTAALERRRAAGELRQRGAFDSAGLAFGLGALIGFLMGRRR